MLTDVETELTNDIKSGLLPMPAKDPDGTVDTIYMVALPPGLSLNDGSGTSCTGNSGWCASHYTLAYSGLQVPYAILPDFSSGGCMTGCGAANGNATDFPEFTFNAAHELVESLTDPDDPQLAWYDKTPNNEIADICDKETTIGMIGTYQVEEWWSNRLGKCISGDPSLPLCGTMRPCRPCAPTDCTGSGLACDTDPTSPTTGQCIQSDGGTTSSTSSGSSSGGSSGSSGGSGGGTSSTSGSGSTSSSGSSSTSGSTGSSGSTSSGGRASSGTNTIDAGDDDGGLGFGSTGASAGCGCVSATGGSGSWATCGGLLFGVGFVLRRRGRHAKRAARDAARD
jgi:hypothetical protein